VLNPSAAAEQAVRLAQSGRYDTICIHGDTEGAQEVASTVRQALRDARVETGPLAES
jgi:5-oxoprolinase (ATP-hydrolysing) subunit A